MRYIKCVGFLLANVAAMLILYVFLYVCLLIISIYRQMITSAPFVNTVCRIHTEFNSNMHVRHTCVTK